jgi:hypothetical protein
MPDTRTTSDRDRSRASRARRGDAALVAQYIHELSERHDGSGQGRPAMAEGEAGGDGAHREDGG